MILACAEEFIVPVAVRPLTGFIGAIFLFSGIFGVITAFTAHTCKALQPPGAPSLSINITTRHTISPRNMKLFSSAKPSWYKKDITTHPRV